MNPARLLIASMLLAATSCGPGDALYRGFFKVDELQVTSEKAPDDFGAMTLNCTQALFGGLQLDIGLISDGIPGMRSNPRHLHIDPAMGGNWSVQYDLSDPIHPIATLKGNRPQELQFAPGNYKIAIYGLLHCDSSSAWRPFVKYSPQNVALSPGKELLIGGNPKIANNNLGMHSNQYPQPSGFAFIINSPPSNSYTITQVDLRSPTFPPLASTFAATITTTSGDNSLGPVPAHGVYLVRHKLTAGGSVSYKCYRFVSTDSTLSGPAGYAPALTSSGEINNANCPQVPTLGPNDQIGP